MIEAFKERCAPLALEYITRNFRFEPRALAKRLLEIRIR